VPFTPSGHADPVDAEHFKAQTEQNERAAVMRLDGELDMSGTFVLEPQLDRLAADQPEHEVLFDLRGLTFIDSTGLSVLIGAHERLREAGVQTRFLRGSDDVQRIFTVAGFDDVLDFTDAP
jgi:anti-anti-sigma factor